MVWNVLTFPFSVVIASIFFLRIQVPSLIAGPYRSVLSGATLLPS